MDEYYDDIPKYRKKPKKVRHPKSDHKHIYENCVFIYDSIKLTYDHGFVPDGRMSIGTYCPICGKIGTICDTSWRNNLGYWPSGSHWKDIWTDNALKEFDESTRTLPSFSIDDSFQKRVHIETGAVPA